MKMNKTITVLTVTRRRPLLLQRAMKALHAQTFDGKIIHRIFIDDCADTLTYLENTYKQGEELQWIYCPREANEYSGPVRLAKLRSIAIRSVQTPYFAFMDDDIVFLPEHYSLLMNAIEREKCQAVYADMALYHADGRAYLDHAFPWERGDKEKTYWKFVENGILTPGSNVKIQRPGVSVDTNVWLFRSDIFGKDFEIDGHFTMDEWQENIAEDEKLMFWLMRNHVDMRPTRDVTVKYYLGGYSNTFGSNTRITDVWKTRDILDKHTVSVITITLNRPSLEAACRSVDRQTYTNWHHYVIGDGVLPLEVENPKRSVFGFTRALGATEPSANMPNGTQNPLQRWALKNLDLGDYICFIDDDNLYDEHFLEKMVAALDAHPEVGIALCGADDQRYHQRMDGVPVVGRCDNSAFLLRSSIAKQIEFPYASMEKDCVQDCEFIITCANKFGWINVPEKLLYYGVYDNLPPQRGRFLFLEGWKKAQIAYKIAYEGNYEAALSMFLEAVEQLPLDAWSHWKIAELYLLLGQKTQALHYYKKWLEMYQSSDYRNYATTVNCGIYNKHIGLPFREQLEEGIRELLLIKEREPDYREHDYILALYYAYLDDFATAEEYLLRANAMNDDKQFWAVKEVRWQLRVYRNDFNFDVERLDQLLR